jgi:hypothetical protein
LERDEAAVDAAVSAPVFRTPAVWVGVRGAGEWHGEQGEKREGETHRGCSFVLSLSRRYGGFAATTKCHFRNHRSINELPTMSFDMRGDGVRNKTARNEVKAPGDKPSESFRCGASNLQTVAGALRDPSPTSVTIDKPGQTFPGTTTFQTQGRLSLWRLFL